MKDTKINKKRVSNTNFKTNLTVQAVYSKMHYITSFSFNTTTSKMRSNLQ
jgi:hypothetical protein